MASSSGEINEAYFGMHLERALNEPMYERIEEHVFGGGTTAKADNLWLQGDMVPLDHLHPKMTVDFGQMTVFFGESVRLFSEMRCRTLS